MKKIYLFLTMLLLSAVGVTQVYAQDEEDTHVVIVNNSTGGWTASSSAAYANEYATFKYSADEISVGVRIQHWNRSGGHNNNMCFTEGNLTMYSAFGSSVSEDYRIYPSKGYYISAISLDFRPFKHPSHEMNGVRVWANADESSAVTCLPGDAEPAHYEAVDLPEAEYIPLTIGQLEEDGNPIFAIASNFTVTLVRRDPIEVILDECQTLFDEYDPIMKSFVTGTEPGCYSEEAVQQLQNRLDYFLENQFNDFTSDEAKALKKSLEDAIQALKDSKVTVYDIPEGYYRIKTALNYASGDKYMLGGKPNATWGSIENEDAAIQTSNAAKALWKISKGTDGYVFVNMYRDERLTDANPAAMDADATVELLVEPVITVNGITYSHLRTANNAEDNSKFYHQSGHSSGNGTAGNVVYWYSSYSFASNADEYTWGGSEWYLEPVSDEDAQAIIAAYAPVKEREMLIENFNATYAEAKEAVKTAKDIKEYTNLITENSQFSSPWTEASEGSLDNLLDGNNTTYWHSAWSGGNVPNHTHYLEVALNEPTHDLITMTISRRISGSAPVANDHITLWGVFGTNDPEKVVKEAVLWTEGDDLPEGVSVGDVKEPAVLGEWEELASLTTPYDKEVWTVTSDEFDTKGYKYLRFYIDGTTTGRGYGHVSEFQLAVPVVNEQSQFAYMGEAATNLDQLLKSYLGITDEEITAEKYEALVAAYDAFKAQFVNPQELRDLLVSVEGIAQGVKVGTQPGYWKDDSTGKALKATYDEAKAYDEAGIYVKAKSDNYITTLNEQVAAVKTAAIGIEEGKWYRFHFGSRDEFEAQGWDLETNDASFSNEIQTNEALWDKFVTVAKYAKETSTVQDEDGNDVEVTTNLVVPASAEDIFRKANLFLDADEDIEEKDLSLFRFVLVGDTAYVIQNKATGLFVKAENSNSAITLGIIPSFFSVQAIGYGQNLISATNLLTNASQMNMHAQRSQNLVVNYSENKAGSRSGFYIDEYSDVATDYAGTAFRDTVHVGEIYAHCYPVNLYVDEEDNEGIMYTVNSVKADDEKVHLTMAPIEKVVAGRPYIYIYGSPDNYDPEITAKEVKFHHGYEFVKEPQTSHALKGSFTSQEINGGYVVSGGNLLDFLGQYATDQARNKFYITQDMITDHVVAFGAYISTEEGEPLDNPGLEITYELTEDPDGIATALNKVAQNGAIYTLDGRLISRNGNLNSLKRLGKGVYIVNGVKVAVK